MRDPQVSAETSIAHVEAGDFAFVLIPNDGSAVVNEFSSVALSWVKLAQMRANRVSDYISMLLGWRNWQPRQT